MANKENHLYRLLYVDNFNQCKAKDLLVSAPNKATAEKMGYDTLFGELCQDVRMLTNGSRPVSKDVIILAPEYYKTLLHGCWTLVECERQDQISRHCSKRSEEDVVNAAEKTRRANRKKRRWSAAEKRARKEAKAAKLALLPSETVAA